MTLCRSTSAETAARFLKMYRAREAVRRQPPRLTGSRWEIPADRVTFLRSILIESVGDRVPRRPFLIVQDARAAFGPCSNRNMWRQLDWLVAHGKIRKVHAGYLRCTA